MILKNFEVRVKSIDSGCFLVITKRQAYLYGIKETGVKSVFVNQKKFNIILRKHLKLIEINF